MKPAILEKLNKELNDPTDTEAKTVYLLVEIRKYLDRCDQKTKNKYPNLYFFCNWVLHIEMDRTPAKLILKRFESITKNHSGLKEISQIFISQEYRFYMFIDLKREMELFFKANSLPNKLLVNSKNWHAFRKLLVSILMDSPLINKKGKIHKFSFVGGSDQQTRFRISVKNKGSFKITLEDITRQFKDISDKHSDS